MVIIQQFAINIRRIGVVSQPFALNFQQLFITFPPFAVAHGWGIDSTV
jgi:hypothetical protein